MEKGQSVSGRKRRRMSKGEVGEISTSSITNSCPSIGCRYIQTLPRKGQSLCRPLCRPRAFLLLSLSTVVVVVVVVAPPFLLHPLSSSRLLLLHLLFSSVSFLFRGKRAGPHSSILPFLLWPAPMEDATEFLLDGWKKTPKVDEERKVRRMSLADD